MTSERDDLCTRRLAPGETLKVRNAAGSTVMCCAGTVWITQENDARDIFLTAGQTFTFDRPGIALICAVEVMRDLWSGNPGIAVIAMPQTPLRATEARAPILREIAAVIQEKFRLIRQAAAKRSVGLPSSARWRALLRD
jgi:hypothetical protein